MVFRFVFVDFVGFVLFRFHFVDFVSFRLPSRGNFVFFLISRLTKILDLVYIPGTYKVRNEIETKRNQRKRNETKGNETKSTGDIVLHCYRKLKKNLQSNRKSEVYPPFLFCAKKYRLLPLG
jgi:hypothetical protein